MNKDNMITGPADWGGAIADDDKSVSDFYAKVSDTRFTILNEEVSDYDIIAADSEPEPKPKRLTHCIECGYDMLACMCNDCGCRYCASMNCSCQPDPEEDEHSVGKSKALDDVDDELIAQSNVPNLGALFKSAKQSGLISQAAGYN